MNEMEKLEKEETKKARRFIRRFCLEMILGLSMLLAYLLHL